MGVDSKVFLEASTERGTREIQLKLNTSAREFYCRRPTWQNSPFTEPNQKVFISAMPLWMAVKTQVKLFNKIPEFTDALFG